MGSGIGQATAVLLATAGVPVVAADINQEGVQETLARVEKAQGQALGVTLDVADEASIDEAFRKAEAWQGSPSILVNSAGILRVDAFESFSREDFNRVLNVNVTGSFLCAQRAAAAMKERAYGRIINLSSVSGYRAGVGRTAYGTSKAAVAQLTRQMALELGRHGADAGRERRCAIQRSGQQQDPCPDPGEQGDDCGDHDPPGIVAAAGHTDGLTEITPELRRKVFGLNAARPYEISAEEIAGIVRGDALSQRRLAYRENPQPHFQTYGPKTRREFLNLLKMGG